MLRFSKSSSKSIFLCFFPVKPTVIHTDMFVNSIGPVNAINMVSKAGVMLQGGRVQLLGGCRGPRRGSPARYLVGQLANCSFLLEFTFIPNAEVLDSKQHLQPVANGNTAIATVLRGRNTSKRGLPPGQGEGGSSRSLFTLSGSFSSVPPLSLAPLTSGTF